MAKSQQHVVPMHRIRRGNEDYINTRRRAQRLACRKAMRNPMVHAVLPGRSLVSPPHATKCRMLAPQEGRDQSAGRMVPKSKDRKTYRLPRHATLHRYFVCRFVWLVGVVFEDLLG